MRPNEILLSEYSNDYIDVKFHPRNFNEVIDALRLIPGRRYLPPTKSNIIPTSQVGTLRGLLKNYSFSDGNNKTHYKIHVENNQFYTQPEYIPVGKRDLRLCYLKRPRDGYELHRFFDEEGVSSTLLDQVSKTPLSLEKNVTLYPFQEECMQFLRENDYNGLVSLDMGLGKTLISCEAIMELGKGPILIVTLASLLNQWNSELKKHYGYSDANIVTSKIKPKKRVEEFCKGDIVITNYEFLRTLDEIPRQFTLLVLDECQRVKNWNTKTAQAIARVPAQRVMGLSGTPVEKNLKELYNIVDAIRPGYFGTMRQFYRDHVRKFGYKVTYRNLEDVYQKLQGIMFRRKKEDIELQLPAITRSSIEVPLSKKEYSFYREMIGECETILEAIVHAKIFASSSALRMNIKTSSKEKELVETIDNIDDRIIVISQYKKEVQRIEQLMERETYILHGGVKKELRTGIIEEFEKTDNGVLLMTTVGSHGLNMQKNRVLINFDLPWTNALLEQRIGRIHRIGSEFDKVFVLNMLSKDTIDHYIEDLICYRKDLSDITIDGAQKYLIEKMRDDIFRLTGRADIL
jgi:SNF2 family DNA or RNA helicase